MHKAFREGGVAHRLNGSERTGTRDPSSGLAARRAPISVGGATRDGGQERAQGRTRGTRDSSTGPQPSPGVPRGREQGHAAAADGETWHRRRRQFSHRHVSEWFCIISKFFSLPEKKQMETTENELGCNCLKHAFFFCTRGSGLATVSAASDLPVATASSSPFLNTYKGNLASSSLQSNLDASSGQ